MLNKFSSFISKNQLFEKQSRILLAVSGGIDSVVMAELFHQAQFSFGIAHCNFGLRGNESDNEEQFVRMLAEKYKVPCYCQAFPTIKHARSNGISVQMAARELRYHWFETIREQKNFDLIATAHHLDDQVETFFINLIRGTGIAGLHGIPIRHGNVIRPLLFANRKEIHEFTLENNLEYRTDSSNASTKYLRNKIRHELIPLISEMNPEFTTQLTSTISRISDIEQIADQAISVWRENVMKKTGHNYLVDIPSLRNVIPLETLAWELLAPFGFNQTQVGNIIQCLDGENSRTFISSTFRLVRNRHQLILQPLVEKQVQKECTISDFARQKSLKHPIPLVFRKINDLSQYEIPTSETQASIDCDKITFPLILRKWMPGDAFYPFGMNRKKKLSDFFIDQKFSLNDKENCWLLCSGKKIIWVVGHRIDHRFRITPTTRKVLAIGTLDT